MNIISQMNLLRSKAWLASSSFLVTAAMGCAAPAFAQETGADTSAGQPQQIQEILVTAQRREQALQDVPLAVSAFNAETLERAGVNSVAEMVYLSPGLVYQGGDNSASPYLRGVGTTSTQSSGEPPLAMYVDGFYYPSFESALLNFANISGIEVLRGPQGTLFGRNVTAGLLQVTTRKPTQELSGELKLGYGNFDQLTASGYLAGGLADNVAGDISVYYSRHDGWGRNLTNGEEASREDQLALRSKWVFEAGSATEISLMLDYSVGESDIGSSTNALPGFIDAAGRPRQGSQFDTLRNLSTAMNRVESWGGGLKIEHDLGFAEIRSLTSHRQMDNAFAIDGDASELNLVNVTVNNHSEYTMQELQLVSGSDSSFDWIVGAFYQDSTGGSRRRPFTLSGDALPPFLGGGYTNSAQVYSESWAIYAQTTAELISGLRGTVGLRYTDDTQRILGNEVALAGFSLGPDVDQSDSWNEFTWRAALDYDFSEEILGYVSYNRGYKAGRFDFLALRDPAVNPEVIDSFAVGLKSDLADRRLRINLEGFYYNYTDIQVEAIDTVAGLPMTINAAKARIAGFEGEITALPVSTLQITAGFSWIPKAEYASFPGAIFQEPLPGGGTLQSTGDASGNRLINTPELTLTLGAFYTIPTSSGDFDINVNYAYNDGHYFDFANLVEEGSFGLLGARVTWTDPSETFKISVFGQNLTDTEYHSRYFPTEFVIGASPGAPRTYGVSVEAAF